MSVRLASALRRKRRLSSGGFRRERFGLVCGVCFSAVPDLLGPVPASNEIKSDLNFDNSMSADSGSATERGDDSSSSSGMSMSSSSVSSIDSSTDDSSIDNDMSTSASSSATLSSSSATLLFADSLSTSDADSVINDIQDMIELYEAISVMRGEMWNHVWVDWDDHTAQL